MFQSRTVFIIGAGASVEANLPIGSTLTSQIASLVDFNMDMPFGEPSRGDKQLFHVLRELAQRDPNWAQNSFLSSGREIAEAMELAPSIDTFLETHSGNREFVLLGKLGIVKAIAEAEKRSKLAPTRDARAPFQMKALAETWFLHLGRQLFSGIPADRPDLAFERVGFIVFNYDRCLEVFLVQALKVYFRINERLAVEIVKEIPIVHPYGSLGSPFEGQEGYAPFASTQFNLLEAADRIKTFSESADSDVTEFARELVDHAQTLVFLGFAFHPQNMNLLAPAKKRAAAGRQIFATTKGLSKPDIAFVEDELAIMLTGEPLLLDQWIHTEALSCNDFFLHFWRSLTALPSD